CARCPRRVACCELEQPWLSDWALPRRRCQVSLTSRGREAAQALLVGTTWEELASFAQAARSSRSWQQPGLWSARPGLRWGLPRRAVRGTSPTSEAPEPTWPRGTGHRLSWSYDRPSRRSTPVRAARRRAASSRPIVPLGAPARTVSEPALCVL